MNLTRTRMVMIVGTVVAVASAVLLALSIPHGSSAEDQTPKLQVDLYVVPEVVTAAYKVYGGGSASKWVAKTIIKNVGKVPVKNLHISYSIADYCKESSNEDYPVILPGQTVRDYCWPNFDSAMMAGINNLSPAELKVTYTYEGLDRPIEDTQKFAFLGRNDFVWSSLSDDDILTWDDNFDNAPMLSSYVTARDPTVEKLSKSITAGMSTGSDESDLEALKLVYTALRDANFQYTTDTNTLWSKDFAQHIQFPVDTLRNMTGNCIDLSLLFSSLLEASGVRTYLLLSSGHCQMAVRLSDSGSLIPIECTTVGDPNITADEAIQLALKTYEEQSANGTYMIVDIEDGWASGMVPSW